MRPINKAVAGLCLALTLWSAVALVTHHHSSADESQTCQICVAATSTAPSPACAQPAPIFIQVSSVPVLTEPAPRQCLSFAVSNRPPPAV